MHDYVRHGDHGRVREIVIDRPAKKNALTGAMYTAIADAMEGADADPAIRAVLLSGTAQCFTSGNDLNDFVTAPPGYEESPAGRFLRVIASASKPIVAAVAGPAIGVGTTLLMHCDLVYAADDAVFQLPFVSIGLVPEAGSTLLLPLMAGIHRASELLMLGEKFDAAEAQAIGLVNRVLPPAQLFDYARSRAGALAAQPPGALRLTKRFLRQTSDQILKQRMADEGAAFVDQLQSAEAVEAMTAFLEKRAPDFSKFG